MSQGEPGGETSLERLLAQLEPRLDPVAYRFVQRSDLPLTDLPKGARALIREEEGWTLVLPEPAGDGLGPAQGARWARIVLSVHSDLAAVGLLAAVATRLAAEGIPVNAMAGWCHDHLFVPWARRHDAQAALSALQDEMAADPSR